MTSYIAVLDGSKTNVEGHSKFLNRAFGPGVPTSFLSTSMQIVQRGAGANMSVDVSVGDVHLELPTQTYSFWGWQDAVSNVVITAADPTNPRIDAIIAYCDPAVTTTASNNSPGALKFSAIAGTPAGSPSAPVDATIQTALGSSVAWTRLANVTVGAAVSSIVTGNISDQRAALKTRVVAGDNTVTTSSIASQAVTGSKITSTDGLLRNVLYYTYNGTNILINGVSQANGANTITYTTPASLKFAQVEVIGGGGGSGGTPAITAGQAAVAPGAGGGGYSTRKISAATIGASQTVTVGAVGAGGAAGQNNGSAGGTSSFGALASATGGGAGAASAAGTSSSAFSAGATGGAGSSGDFNLSGGDGGNSEVLSGSRVATGTGGNSFYGAMAGQGNAGAGTAGKNYGGGAAGASASGSTGTQAGAAGGGGIVIIREYY